MFSFAVAVLIADKMLPAIWFKLYVHIPQTSWEKTDRISDVFQINGNDYCTVMPQMWNCVYSVCQENNESKTKIKTNKKDSDLYF